MPSTLHADDGSSKSGHPAINVQFFLNPQRIRTISSFDMGGRNSVPEESVIEDSVKETMAYSQNCCGVENSLHEVKTKESELIIACERPVQSEIVSHASCDITTQDRDTATDGKENMFANGKQVSEDDREQIKVKDNSRQDEPYINSLEERLVKPKESLGLSKIKIADDTREEYQKGEISNEACDNFSSITTTNVFKTNSNRIRSKCDVDYSKSKQINNENISTLISNETIDCISKTGGQNNNLLPSEVGNKNWKDKVVDIDCDTKLTKKGNLLTEEIGARNPSDQLNLEVSPMNFENTIAKVQKGQISFDRRKEINGSDDINQTVNGQGQQIQSELMKDNVSVKNNERLQNVISISDDESSGIFDKNCKQLEVDKVDENEIKTCDKEHFEIECVSKPSSDEITLEAGKCEINTTSKGEASKRLSIQTELQQELHTNSTGSPTKVLGADCSSEISEINKPVIFKRGSFPRIALKDYGIRTIKRLKRQLLMEREKREKQEQRQRERLAGLGRRKGAIKKQGVKNAKVRKNVCNLKCDSPEMNGFAEDMKLKCAKVCLVKMNESLLSKYNVHLPSVQSGAFDSKQNDVLSQLDEELSLNEKSNNLNSEITFQIESVTPKADGSGQIEKKKIPDNSLGCLEVRPGAKRRTSLPVHTSTKKQKQSEMRIARVHILKIDNTVLSKYGYDSKYLKNDEAAVVPSTMSAQLSSVSSSINGSYCQKATVNSRLNCQILQPTCVQSKVDCLFPNTVGDIHSVTMMNSGDKEETIDNIEISTTNSCKNTSFETTQQISSNEDKPLSSQRKPLEVAQTILRDVPLSTRREASLEIAQLTFNEDDLPLSSRVLLKKKSLGTDKSIGKTKCSVKRNGLKVKTCKVPVRRTKNTSLSSCISSNNTFNLSTAESITKTKRYVKSNTMDQKIPQVIIKKIENVPLSNRDLLKKPLSTTEPTRMKNSFKLDYHLKSAKVVLKNIDNSRYSDHVLLKSLSIKGGNDSISKDDLFLQSSEILHGKTPKKQTIFCHSKYCDHIQNQNEDANKASSCKSDVAQDYSKENVCLNSNLKCLKDVRVNLYKLENTPQMKLISAKPVMFNV